MKKILALLLIFVLALSFAACTSTETTEPETTEGDTTSELPLTGIKIGVAACHMTNAWNTTDTNDIIDKLEAAGATVVWNEAKNDTATQVANVNDLIAQGIQYLVIKPKEEEGLVPAMEACKAANVKVILVDRSVKGEAGVDYVTAIRTDAYNGGHRIGEWVTKKFPDGCNIIEITGTAGSTTAIERTKGFADAISGTKCTVIATQTGNYSRTDTQTATENMIQAEGIENIDVIMTHSDEMLFGVLQAVDGMGYTPGKDVIVVSSGDGCSDALDEIIAGRVAAVCECTPFLGAQVTQVIEDIEAGKTVDTLIYSNDRLFTIENAAEEQAKATW
ncbi:MAG: ABC transporter substrate-binding protein [Oscillospiraceae bacterium]|nr:ABC transporter substrate-binding protein [Oscillospiraceae bacterium]